MDPLYGSQLDLHVRQVPHHPIEVVGHLWEISQSHSLIMELCPRSPEWLSLQLRKTRGPSCLLLTTGYLFRVATPGGMGGHNDCGSSPHVWGLGFVCQQSCPQGKPWVGGVSWLSWGRSPGIPGVLVS